MADAATTQDAPSFFDKFIAYGKQIAPIYQQVTLAQKGVATPTVIYQTNGKGDPVIAAGQPADVQGTSDLAQAINGIGTKAAAAYSAKQLHDSMPYILGMTAAVIAIYMLTRN